MDMRIKFSLKLKCQECGDELLFDSKNIKSELDGWGPTMTLEVQPCRKCSTIDGKLRTVLMDAIETALKETREEHDSES